MKTDSWQSHHLCTEKFFTNSCCGRKYRTTTQHGNADALSKSPAGPDLSCNGEESHNDVDTVCTIRTIKSQPQPYSINQQKDSTKKDSVISEVKHDRGLHIDRPKVQEFKKY